MICDVIVNYCDENSTDSFTVKDLWHSPSFENSMRHDFGKPSTRHPGSKREYDKVILQPLNVLHSACVLDLVAKRPKKFAVKSGFKSVLEKLAGNEQGAVEFLAAYVSEVLRQSGLRDGFAAFFAQESKDAFALLKRDYCAFMIKHTRIQRKEECNRIFPKVLNVQAYKFRKRGAESGELSLDTISLDKIRYNRLNFRDKQKPKHIPRQQQQNARTINVIPDAVHGKSRFVQNTIKDVKAYHAYKPEIQDEYAATPTKAGVQGHHIFPRAEYPALSFDRENIILLSATQHTAQAHEGTHAVSATYQQLCLLKKLESIKECDSDPNCNFYSFGSFKEMLAFVGILNAANKGDDAKARNRFSYDDVMRIIVEHYSGAK